MLLVVRHKNHGMRRVHKTAIARVYKYIGGVSRGRRCSLKSLRKQSKKLGTRRRNLYEKRYIFQSQQKIRKIAGESTISIATFFMRHVLGLLLICQRYAIEVHADLLSRNSIEQ